MPTIAFDTIFVNYIGPNSYDANAAGSAFFKYYRAAYIYSANPDINVSTANALEAANNSIELVSWKGTSPLTHTAVSTLLYSFATQNSAATASGTATHFVFWGSGSTNQADPGWGFKGTIGLPGTGSDMVIGNTSIVSGVSYNIGTWAYYAYPTEFTY